MKKLLATVLSVSLLALPATATWSVVAVNTRTGEVGVASATCLANFPLQRWVPVVVVGKGGGAAQSSLDGGAVNRQRMWDGLVAGWTPEMILDDLITNGTQPVSRQYGISAMPGPSATWSGAQCGQGLGNVTGQIGDYFYAIQGNLLTGEEPVLAAEQAFVATDGDMGQRIMAAMEAARLWGGDGRCSCSDSDPTGCGAPPSSFEKSAHCGFVYVARMGDVDGDCSHMDGCATGDYYLKIRDSGDWGDPDPVFVLQRAYDGWRANLAGRPDHILSTATLPVHSLPADGVKQTMATVSLVDVNGDPLPSGSSKLYVTVDNPWIATAGDVTNHHDGTYSFPVTAGTVAGTTYFTILADDGVARATLYPYLELRVDPVVPMHVGRDTVSSSEYAEVPLTLNTGGPGGGWYVILASASGTEPGIQIQDVILPLNPDDLFWRSVWQANNERFQNTLGQLDPAGRAEALFTSGPHMLNNLIGRRIHWAALYSGPDLEVTNPAGFDVTF